MAVFKKCRKHRAGKAAEKWSLEVEPGEDPGQITASSWGSLGMCRTEQRKIGHRSQCQPETWISEMIGLA